MTSGAGDEHARAPGAEDAPGLDSPELALGVQLRAARPVPSAGFRGALGRHLGPGPVSRPAHLWWIVGGCLTAGSVPLVLALLQATGSL